MPLASLFSGTLAGRREGRTIPAVHEGSELKGEQREASGGPAPAPADAIERTEDECPILCGACRSVVTSCAAKVSVHGAYAHRRVNPSGVDFLVGCFAEAPGCVAEGAPTTFWTWFPGYAWQIASCRRCAEHLGWVFRGESAFFGLILTRLIEE